MSIPTVAAISTVKTTATRCGLVVKAGTKPRTACRAAPIVNLTDPASVKWRCGVGSGRSKGGSKYAFDVTLPLVTVYLILHDGRQSTKQPVRTRYRPMSGQQFPREFNVPKDVGPAKSLRFIDDASAMIGSKSTDYL